MTPATDILAAAEAYAAALRADDAVMTQLTAITTPTLPPALVVAYQDAHAAIEPARAHLLALCADNSRLFAAARAVVDAHRYFDQAYAQAGGPVAP